MGMARSVTPRHYQHITHQGACRKAPVVPHNSRPLATLRNGADDVTSLSTTAFDLPHHLTAKSDPILITRDEQHFVALAESLERTIGDLSDRLDAERRAPGRTGQAA